MKDIEQEVRSILDAMAREIDNVPSLPARIQRRARRSAVLNALLFCVILVGLISTGTIGFHAWVRDRDKPLPPADHSATQIAVDVFQRNKTPGEDPRSYLYVIRSDGDNLRRVTGKAVGFATSPSWSPDNDQLAFARVNHNRAPGRASVSVVDIDGSNLTKLYSAPRAHGIQQVAWSPDENNIAFIEFDYSDIGNGSEANIKYTLFVMDSDGDDVTALTSDEYRPVSFSWSGDGEQLVFSDERLGDNSRFLYDLYTIDAEGENIDQLTDDGRSTDPAWSPDGSQIAFTSYGGETSFRERDIYVMDSDGTDRAALVVDDKTQDHPTWSPDGSEIAYTNYGRRRGCQLWAVDVENQGVRQIVGRRGLGGCPNFPAWERP